MRSPRFVLPCLVLAVLMVLAGPSSVAAGDGPAPSEACVPGTIWEDTVSGVTYICIYDELYGGSRWERLSSGQSGTDGWMFRSSSSGCAYGDVTFSTRRGAGALALVRSYRWPCRTYADRAAQPAGELRARIVIQRYSGGWSTCRDSGYRYSSVSAYGWFASLGMGATPDCGAGTYRAWGFGSLYQGSAWRGGSWTTSPLYLR